MSKSKPSRLERARAAIRLLVDMEIELGELGLHVAARKVNAAQQQIGWDLASALERERNGD